MQRVEARADTISDFERWILAVAFCISVFARTVLGPRLLTPLTDSG